MNNKDRRPSYSADYPRQGGALKKHLSVIIIML